MRIFISYRREDSQDISSRLYDRLVALWGQTQVFKDIPSINAGTDFRATISHALTSCETVLAVIGRNWAIDASGHRRLDEPGDFVRIEIETALQQHKYIIPVLVGGASMPHAAEIPSSIKELTFRQALKVGSDPEFNSDVERLNKALNTLLHEGAHEGYCYLNREGIDQLMAKMEIAPSKNPSYRNKVLALLARLDARGVLSTLARPGEHQ